MQTTDEGMAPSVPLGGGGSGLRHAGSFLRACDGISLPLLQKSVVGDAQACGADRLGPNPHTIALTLPG